MKTFISALHLIVFVATLCAILEPAAKAVSALNRASTGFSRLAQSFPAGSGVGSGQIRYVYK